MIAPPLSFDLPQMVRDGEMMSGHDGTVRNPSDVHVHGTERHAEIYGFDEREIIVAVFHLMKG